jgi:hypothetical protein
MHQHGAAKLRRAAVPILNLSALGFWFVGELAVLIFDSPPNDLPENPCRVKRVEIGNGMLGAIGACLQLGG